MLNKLYLSSLREEELKQDLTRLWAQHDAEQAQREEELEKVAKYEAKLDKLRLENAALNGKLATTTSEQERTAVRLAKEQNAAVNAVRCRPPSRCDAATRPSRPRCLRRRSRA